MPVDSTYATDDSQRSFLRELMVKVIVLAVVTPSIAGVVSFRVDEFNDAEVEFKEKLEEALGSQRVLRTGRRHYMCRVFSYRVLSADRLRPSHASSLVEGHRLWNGLLAPLTC